MNFPFYIARRYLFSKKSTHAINVISLISVLGVAVATMALVVVLSGFNGFSDLVASFFTNFDPQLKIEATKGKAMPADDPLLIKVKHLPGVEVATECVQDQALAVYHDKQAMVTVKGVEDNFDSLTHISNILYGDGDFTLHVANLQYGVIGIRLAQDLGTGVTWQDYLQIYAPQREGQYDASNPTDAFVKDSLVSPGALFQVKQSKYDQGYIITSIDFARRIFNRQGEITSLELRMKPGVDIDNAKEEIQAMLGDKYKVLDRYEQQADTFNIMRIEKLFAYVFLTFILMVACFNIIGSLSMLIIDKKNDVITLRNLGATDGQIRRIFLFEGRMISAAGAVIGIVLGLILCWLQQTYGLVQLGDQAGNFVVNAYPISVHPEDILLIFLTVILVGWLSVWYPVRYMSRKLTKE
ncbi:MacB-like periplasmic core domain / efflux ABC transporter, permease multi-domain protein [Prevotella sp. oral taxon 306 str. F0472]|uniref:FtsX-like permease family protein n=1 Tax=Prevotella sp. oral taxon 306 TaxID=712461 RepID=UPI00025BB9F2|nr:FtsX-like permease family protein [Prevotella sp. oral taxon 306]EID34555.1 MacB-like periplasmic core domain / efflux ABC transporter, permease multi-domain protein [Prevotella sp. oral taxon 306 str. F0472]